VKQKLLDVAWEDASSDFGYRDSRGGRVLLELAPVPSWHKLWFRRRQGGEPAFAGPPPLPMGFD
jgi:hypothetical protein